jgi:hypothetical protein
MDLVGMLCFCGLVLAAASLGFTFASQFCSFTRHMHAMLRIVEHCLLLSLPLCGGAFSAAASSSTFEAVGGNYISSQDSDGRTLQQPHAH